MNDACVGTLFQDGREIVGYAPEVDWADTRNGSVRLDAYTQHVTLYDGDIRVQTGHRYSHGSTGSHRNYEFGLEPKPPFLLDAPDDWQEGPVSGVIRISHSNLRTKATEQLEAELAGLHWVAPARKPEPRGAAVKYVFEDESAFNTLSTGGKIKRGRVSKSVVALGQRGRQRPGRPVFDCTILP